MWISPPLSSSATTYDTKVAASCLTTTQAWRNMAMWTKHTVFLYKSFQCKLLQKHRRSSDLLITAPTCEAWGIWCWSIIFFLASRLHVPWRCRLFISKPAYRIPLRPPISRTCLMLQEVPVVQLRIAFHPFYKRKECTACHDSMIFHVKHGSPSNYTNPVTMHWPYLQRHVDVTFMSL